MIDELFAIIEDRKARMPAGSYTAQLLSAGDGLILKKVGEEAIEVILAATREGDQRLLEEAADLIYHLLVLLADHGLQFEDVQAELRRRHIPDHPPAP
jgi:phosphoribosyl-ATP pyrophosphohydrolase